MLNRNCQKCKNEARYGYVRFTKRIIQSCTKMFIQAKKGDKIYCPIDGSVLYVDEDERDY
jgi:hypothetical protein